MLLVDESNCWLVVLVDETFPTACRHAQSAIDSYVGGIMCHFSSSLILMQFQGWMRTLKHNPLGHHGCVRIAINTAWANAGHLEHNIQSNAVIVSQNT